MDYVTTKGTLVIYRRTRWTKGDREWDIEVLEDFTQSLDACFKWFVPEGNVAVLIVEHHRDGKVFT